MKMRIMHEIIKVIKYRFNLDDDKAVEEEVLGNIKKGVEFRGTNLWTLIFAIIIASIGLNVNSTAVIIGAMLISPLMGPIMGLGLGAAIFDITLIKSASKNLLVATLIGLGTSTIYFLSSPLHTAQSELLARTSPNIWDVLIAFFGGLAGIVASSRKKFNNIIPGVAIATALMPPLCTAGYGIATAQWSYFFGAFYLYLINSVFISISTFLIVRFLKYKTVQHVNVNTQLIIKRWIGIIAVGMIIPSLYLAFLFVKNEIFSQNATKLINEEILSSNYVVLNQKIVPQNNEIFVTILGETNLDSLKKFLDLRKVNYGLADAVIVIKNNIVSNGSDKTLTQLKEGIIEDLFIKQEEKLRLKDEEIAALKYKIESNEAFVLKKKEAIDEFYALYGVPKEIIIEQAISHNDLSLADTVLIVYINADNTKPLKNIKQIEEWLKIKFKISKTKILLN